MGGAHQAQQHGHLGEGKKWVLRNVHVGTGRTCYTILWCLGLATRPDHLPKNSSAYLRALLPLASLHARARMCTSRSTSAQACLVHGCHLLIIGSVLPSRYIEGANKLEGDFSVEGFLMRGGFGASVHSSFAIDDLAEDVPPLLRFEPVV